jgi:hypothetical protein
MPDQDDRVTRPFADWIREQRKGDTHEELSAALNDLVSAVTAHNKPGSLTVTFKVEPHKDLADVLVVKDEIKVKAPQAKRTASIFYATRDGNLQRDDPNQMPFDGMTVIEGERQPDVREKAAGDVE